MHEAFQPLVARVQVLGNTSRKYLGTIERHGEALVARLESEGILSHIHLHHTSPALSEGFRRIASVARDTDECLWMLGTYYAVQFLHQNARTFEQLALDLAERTGRLKAYSAFIERNELQFRQIVSAYVEQVLEIVTPAEAGPFLILNVGTPGHQDDIDMAVVHDGTGDRAALDRAMARLASQCQRYASALDNYFANEVGVSGFSMSVEELHDALSAGGVGFVLVTELLRAEPVVGDAPTLRLLRDQVMAEYMFRGGRDNVWHELYLRGILGEIRSLLLRPLEPSSLSPKDDALRLITGLAMAFKVIEGIPATQPAAILRAIAASRPELREAIARIEESLIFVETFWQTAQMLVALDEDVAVEGEAERENLNRIAVAMGYRDRGPIKAADHLLVHYHDYVEDAHAAAAPLMRAVTSHLMRRSRFSRWLRARPPQDYAIKLGRILVGAARSFRGVRFYDDLVEAFANPEGHALGAFVRSFLSLPDDERVELARRFAIWGCDAPYTLMTLVTLMARFGDSQRASRVVGEVVDAFLDALDASAEIEPRRAVARVYRAFPAMSNRFLFQLNDARLARLDRALDVNVVNLEVASARDGFRALILVHRRCSRYVKRVLSRVTERHPATVAAITDDNEMRMLALGQLAASERQESPETQKGLLGDFYDIEFLRIAMRTLRATPIAFTRGMFAELTSTYLERLFDLCFRQVEHETGGWVAGRDCIGLLLSGGNARGRPYDEDFDLIAILDSEDAAVREIAERVVVLMNGQIAQRGVIPQYRLAEWLGRHVATFDEVTELLQRDDRRLFVDRCQFLGSRLVIGGRRMATQVTERVMRPLIFADPLPFVDLVRQEIRERRRAKRTILRRSLHLKEDPGGLREIDLALAASKARHGVWETPGVDPFHELARRDRPLAATYRRMAVINDFFVSVRSVYRVTVSATATIEPEFLVAPARLLGVDSTHERGAADRLYQDIAETLHESADLVDRILDA
jgi:hypothetical protein